MREPAPGDGPMEVDSTEVQCLCFDLKDPEESKCSCMLYVPYRIHLRSQSICELAPIELHASAAALSSMALHWEEARGEIERDREKSSRVRKVLDHGQCVTQQNLILLC